MLCFGSVGCVSPGTGICRLRDPTGAPHVDDRRALPRRRRRRCEPRIRLEHPRLRVRVGLHCACVRDALAGRDRARRGDRRRATQIRFGIEQRLAQRHHGLEPRFRLLREAAQQDLLDARWDLRVEAARHRRQRGHLLDQDLAHRVAVEREHAGHHLEQQDAERVDVGPVIDVPLALAGLGRHVLRGPEQDACRGLHRRRARRLEHLREPKIEDLDEVRIAQPRHQHDVVGLEIAVDDAGDVRRGQRARDLCAHVQRTHGVERGLAGEHRGERLTLEILHDVEVVALGRDPEVVDLDDVLVADLVDRAGLLEEALHDLLVAGELAVDDLERHLLPDQRVLGEIDHAHPTGADLRDDPVVADRLAGSDHCAQCSASASGPRRTARSRSAGSWTGRRRHHRSGRPDRDAT